MNKLKNFIVYGVGRCGSHWVESIIIDLCGGVSKSLLVGNNDLVQLLPNGWLIHTHNLDLVESQKEIKESTMFVRCSRQNKFEQAISYLVANKTNEWFVYSNKEFIPFIIDPQQVADQIADLIGNSYHEYEFPNNIWPNFVDIVYEDIANSEIPEKYIAERLGLEYKKTQGWAQHGSRKNPRNYKDLILNWNELNAMFNNVA